MNTPCKYLHRSLDEHAVTASAYASIVCMSELLTILKIEDPTDVGHALVAIRYTDADFFVCSNATFGFRNHLTL